MTGRGFRDVHASWLLRLRVGLLNGVPKPGTVGDFVLPLHKGYPVDQDRGETSSELVTTIRVILPGMGGEIVVGIREGVLRGCLQIGPPPFGCSVAEENLVLGALDRPHNRGAPLARHLRAIDADRGGGQLYGLDSSHAHRVGQGRFLPLLLCTQEPLERAKLAGGIEKLFNFGGVRVQLPRVELSRPGEKISQRGRHIALVPAGRAEQAGRECDTVLEEVEIMTAQDPRDRHHHGA